METARQSYVAKGASQKDIDWAIQNARIVQQSMQMRSGEVARDQSMAENIKWIADHSAGAKIVLWAHFSEDAPSSYVASLKPRDCRDAILFVESTTAAHKNP